MSMTITEKILAKAAEKNKISSNENIWINVDLLMTHDVCGPATIGIFKEQFGQNAKVFNKDKVVIIPDHYIFTKDKHANRNLEILRQFAKEQNLTYFYDAHSKDYQGVCHVTLAQEGHNLPGIVLFGTDSHTCTSGAFGLFSTGVGNTDAALIMGTGKIWVKVPESMKFIFNGPLPKHVMAKDIILEIIGNIGVEGATYRAMEFAGDTIANLNMEERMTICNMAIEAGGKNGIIEADQVTEQYVQQRSKKSYTIFKSDPDAHYFFKKEYDASKLKSVVAMPHSPDKKAYAQDLKNEVIDQAYIGSCTGGKNTDFIAAAKILKGQKVKIKTFIVPATRKVEEFLNQEKIDGKTLHQIFADSGCLIGEPSCAACLGGPVDTFGRTHKNERVISTTNRNFPGRMGSKDAPVYLASPFTVAATALTGKITDPKNYL